jgi:integrase
MARSSKGEGSFFKTGKGWRGYVTVNGQRRYFSAPTKTEASLKKRALLNQRDTGELSAGRVPTLGEWLEHWLTISQSEHRASTHAGYAGYIKNYIEPELGTTKLNKLTIDRLEAFYAQLEQRGLSGSTRHQVHSIIRVALKQAVWRGHIGRNVAALIKPPTPSKRVLDGFSAQDLHVISAALIGHRYEARWQLGLALGLRPGEATALEWSHIDFETNMISIRQQLQQVSGQGTILVPYTKSDSGIRTIPVPEFIMTMLATTRENQLREMLEAGSAWYRWEPDGQPHAFCFTQRNGQPLRPGHDGDQWRAILSAAGLPHSRRYAARHTAASWLIAHGIDAVTVSKILGHHSSTFTLNTYVHAIDERLEEAAAILDKVHYKVHPQK